MNLKTWPLLAALFVLASCWSPVYDKDISMATLTASKMDLDASFEVNNFGTTSVGWTRAFASGERQPAYVMILKVDGTSYQSAFWQRDMAGKYSSTATGGGSFRPNVDLDTITVAPLVTVTPGTAFGVLFPTGGSVADSNTNQAGVLRILYSTVNFAEQSTRNYEASGSSSVLGFATGLTASGSQYLLSKNSSAVLALYKGPLNSTSNLGMTALPTSPTGLSLVPGTLAVDDRGPNEVVYFAQKVSSTSWRTQKFQLPSPFVESSFTTPARVVTFLTSRGQLLMKEASYFAVCDTSGNALFHFPAGNLNFSALYLDGGVPRIAFTVILPKAGEGKGSAAEVRVYSIPVAELERLR